MASVNDQDPRQYTRGSTDAERTDAAEHRERKASSLTAREPGVSGERPLGRSGRRAATEVPDTRRHTSIWVDILLLVLLASLVTGGVFGYRALRDAYAPVWETRTVVFEVEFSGIAQDIPTTYWNKSVPLYASPDVDAQPIGQLELVTSGEMTPADSDAPDGMVSKIVYLTLRATVRYRPGEGYFSGDVPLLAGSETYMRVDGKAASGLILWVCEEAEYDRQTTKEN